jgi:peptidoglycan hydrolase-like protein with peptidoglycan-binding domain
MRVSAAILAVIVGGSAALAQSDPRANPAPPAAAKSEAKSEPTTDSKASPEAKAKPKAKTARKEPKPATTGTAAAAAPLKPSGLQDVYAAIPAADRAAIQHDLTWGGDFTAPIDGEFSERLVAAVKAYQARHKNPVTGVMSAEERKALALAVEPRKQAVGWRLAEDPVTGARLGLPGKFATKVTALQSGTRWSSEQGQMQVETFRIDTGATLDALFEQQKKMPRRRVESSAMQADSFVITGMQGLKKMVVRAYARNGEVRGITILYDQAMEGTGDPLVAPMSSAFVPFPTGVTLAGGAGAPRRKVEYGTGVFVSAVGHVLTDRNLLDGCNVIALPGIGNAERIAADVSGELVLLRVYGARNLIPIGTIGGAPPSGSAVTLVGVADPQTQGGGAAVSAVNAKLGAEASTRPLETVPALGFSGSAVLDTQGRFAGMTVLKAPVVAGPSGAPQAAVVPVDRIRNFLEANYVAPASGKPGVEETKASVARVICVRK